MAIDMDALKREQERFVLQLLSRPRTTAAELDRKTESELSLNQFIAVAKASPPMIREIELELDTSSETVQIDSINLFLESIYQDVQSSQSRYAVKRIFKHFNWLLANERFGYVDQLLARVQPIRLDVDTALSFMTITFAARDKLNERHSLHKLIFDRISALAGMSKAEKLLNLTESDVIKLLDNPSDADSFSQKLRYLSLQNRIDEAMLAVYRRVATLRRLNDRKECNRLLSHVDVERTELGVLVALLMSTATLPRNELPSWQHLYDETYVKYTNERGEAEATAALDSLK